MPAELTKETIERAFDAMGQMAAERGLVFDIAVYGGSCLVLASDIRNASVDVDAVFLTSVARSATSRMPLHDAWGFRSIGSTKRSGKWRRREAIPSPISCLSATTRGAAKWR